MKVQEIFVQLDGTILTIGDALPELAGLGEVHSERASSILPVNRVKRLLFVALRAMFGERGRVAEWTRSWKGSWRVIVFATGETCTFAFRESCLRWEHERLRELMSL